MDSDEKNDESILFHFRPIPTYVYPGLQLLEKEEPSLFYKGDIIHIYGYFINQSGQHPFLQICLTKKPRNPYEDDNLVIPYFCYGEGFPVMEHSSLVVDRICASYKVTTGKPEYQGFLRNDNNVYLFFDFTSCDIAIHELSEYHDLFFVTIDEIMHHGKMCKHRVDVSAIDFFTKQPECMYLQDTDGKTIECPTIVYQSTSREKMDFMLYFGNSPQICETYSSFSHFYFTTYEEALQQNTKSLVRFALFLGNMHIFIDKETSDNREYDSLYIGSPHLAQPMWGVRSHQQQCSLSCHVIMR